MKKTVLKLSFYVFVVVLFLGFFAQFADGNTDDNYRHFSSPKATSLILGDSRSAQTVVPQVLDKKISGHKFDNFSLNIVDSPYGKIYFEAIQKKLDKTTSNGIFIVTVDPWNISLDKSIEHEKDFPEVNSPLRSMHFYGINPNYEYLLRHYKKTWYHLYRDREEVGKSNTYLHENGWMEVNVGMTPAEVEKRKIEKIDFYQKMMKGLQISQIRLDALVEIIEYLKTKGTVYLMRIPASEEIMRIENHYCPDFNNLIQYISKKSKVNYFDFSTQVKDYMYTDGNHMHQDSGKKLTSKVADSIIKYQRNK